VSVEGSVANVLAAANAGAAGSGSTVVVVGWRADCNHCAVPAPGLGSSTCTVSYAAGETSKTCTAIFGLQ
jgi:hypothetical protein